MELVKLLSEKELKDAALLILANKQVGLITTSKTKFCVKHVLRGAMYEPLSLL